MRIKTILIVLLIGLILYKWDYVKALRFLQLTPECATEHELRVINDPSIKNNEKLEVSKKFWDCIESKQSWLERQLIKVPNKWKND